MKINSLFKSCMIMFCVTSVSGCTDFFIKEDIRGDLDSKLNTVRTTVKPSNELVGLEPLELRTYTPYRIADDNDFAEAIDDPFVVKPFVRQLGQENLALDDQLCKNGCGDGPPEKHTPYFLESYDLEQLQMTGSLSYPGRGKLALIQTPDAGIVHARLGEYIGQNNGLILSIDNERVIIREKYRSSQGWEDRMYTLQLIRN